MSMSERTPSFLTQFADMLQRVSTQENRWNASNQNDLLADTSFEINVFKRYIKVFSDYEDIITRRRSDIVMDDRYFRIMWRGGSSKKNNHETVHVKDVTEYFEGMLNFMEK